MFCAFAVSGMNDEFIAYSDIKPERPEVWAAGRSGSREQEGGPPASTHVTLSFSTRSRCSGLHPFLFLQTRSFYLLLHQVIQINPRASWHALPSDNASAPLHIHKLCRYGTCRWQLPVVSPGDWRRDFQAESSWRGDDVSPSVCTFIFRVVLLMLPIQHLAGSRHKGREERERTTCSLADLNKRLTHVWWAQRAAQEQTELPRMKRRRLMQAKDVNTAC